MSPENFALPVRRVRQGGDHPLIERHAARLAVVGFDEGGVAAIEIDIAPVQPERLAEARAGAEQ
jgi:hypothetical protein